MWKKPENACANPANRLKQVKRSFLWSIARVKAEHQKELQCPCKSFCHMYVQQLHMYHSASPSFHYSPGPCCCPFCLIVVTASETVCKWKPQQGVIRSPKAILSTPKSKSNFCHSHQIKSNLTWLSKEQSWFNQTSPKYKDAVEKLTEDGRFKQHFQKKGSASWPEVCYCFQNE